MSRQDDIKKLIAEHQRHLQLLRQQEAGYGSLNVPTHILTQIQDREDEIEKLQTELAELERGEETPAPPKLASSPAVSAPPAPTYKPDPELSSWRAKPRLFLCHASEDKPRVKELYHLLKEAGYRPWLDKFDLLPGQDWEFEIRQVIRESGFFPFLSTLVSFLTFHSIFPLN